MVAVLRVIAVLLTVLYPLAIYIGLQSFHPRYLILLLLAVLLLRLLSLGKSPLNHWAWLPLLCILGLWTWLDNSPLALKLYPVLVSASLLLLFGWSLYRSPSMVERFARFKETDLSAQAIVYTRKVTQLWCGFFLINGSIALAITLYGSDYWWALYNGLISYIAMGLLFSVEWLFRQRVIKAAND